MMRKWKHSLDGGKQHNVSRDFSQGKISNHILAQAIPLVLAQLVHLTYNVVDRVYIGHMPGSDSLALTGVGLAFPLTTLIAAFTLLFGSGGAPLFAIARGAEEEEEAEEILGNTFSMLLISSVILCAFCYLFREPVLYLFGASDESYVYADAYLRVYLWGTPFVMISTGLNGFINAQGFPRIGMMTTVIGAILNLILDPVFIFGLDMGVAGAAFATVISQIVSAIWVIVFLTGRQALLRIRYRYMKPNPGLLKEIIQLGLSGFIMQGTNCLVQVVCNATLRSYGGDLYVGVMTILHSVRELFSLPVIGLSNGAQPVIGFNYGAGKYDRVCKGIRFMAIIGIVYTLLAWIFIIISPSFFIGIFTDDPAMLDIGAEALGIYFFGFFFMAFQFSGQSTFTALKDAKHAVFFSLLRKAIIVAPLTVLLPVVGFGVNGVFWAEPISNAIGGLACFLTMYFCVYRRLSKSG